MTKTPVATELQNTFTTVNAWDLTGEALEWAVETKVHSLELVPHWHEGKLHWVDEDTGFPYGKIPQYARDWKLTGKIKEKFKVGDEPCDEADERGNHKAWVKIKEGHIVSCYAESAQIAICRVVLAVLHSQRLRVPDVLLEKTTSLA